MIKKKKLDDLDLVFINEPWTEEERKSFSAYLKAKKLQLKTKKKLMSLATRKRKNYA